MFLYCLFARFCRLELYEGRMGSVVTGATCNTPVNNKIQWWHSLCTCTVASSSCLQILHSQTSDFEIWKTFFLSGTHLSMVTVLSWLISISDFNMADSVTNTSKIFNQSNQAHKKWFPSWKTLWHMDDDISWTYQLLFMWLIFVCYVLPNIYEPTLLYSLANYMSSLLLGKINNKNILLSLMNFMNYDVTPCMVMFFGGKNSICLLWTVNRQMYLSGFKIRLLEFFTYMIYKKSATA